jgi:hypothetical protein
MVCRVLTTTLCYCKAGIRHISTKLYGHHIAVLKFESD